MIAMRTTEQWLTEYGESHQNPTNKLVHWICVPLIMFSLLGLLWSIPAGFLQAPFPDAVKPFINFATVFMLVMLIFYLRLSLPLFLGMVVVSGLMILGLYGLERVSPLPMWLTSLIIFVAAWIGQFFGHKVEGKKPSFLKDVQFLLIGPAWILSFIYRKLSLQY